MSARPGPAVAFALALVTFGCGEVKPPGGPQDGATADGSPRDGTPPDGPSPGDGQVAAPVVTLVLPDWGSMEGGTTVEVQGRNFMATGAGTPVVRFGATAGSQVTVVDDRTLHVVSPAGPYMPVGVEVETAGGTARWSGQYRYLAPLYAGDGTVSTIGNLYRVDPSTAQPTTIGPINFGITGLALSTAGVLYASTTAPAGGPFLITIDPYTGAGTMIGRLLANGQSAGSSDLAFVGSRLLGFRKDTVTGTPTTFMTEINVANATVMKTQSNAPVAGGNGMASPDGLTLYLSPEIMNKRLFQVNVQTAQLVGSPVPLNGPTGALNSLTYVGRNLYGSLGTGAVPNNTVALYRINPTTGAMTLVGQLPKNIDAIEGIPEQVSPFAPRAATVATPSAPSPRHAAEAGPTTPPCGASIELRGAGAPRVLALADVTALPGRDVVAHGRQRRVVPLASLAPRARSVEVIGCDGASRRIRLGGADAEPLVLTPNQRGQLKLVDARAGMAPLIVPVAAVRVEE